MNRSEGTPSPGPSAAQIAATIALLGDDRDVIRTAARERLLRWGEAALPQLQEGAEAEHVPTRLQCRGVLRAVEVRDCLQRFARLELDRGGRRSAPALLEGAVLLSKMVRTFVPDAGDLAVRLRREAGALKDLFAGRSLPTRARLLAERLHEQFGLGGRDASPVDLDHCMIDRVLDRRIGVPVTLSLIYLLVARWAGLSVSGVAMPDHFLVRLHGVRPVLVDPYHGGRTVTKADCGRHLRANGYDHVSEHLRDLTDRELLIHYLQALRRAAGRQRRAETQATLGHALALLETT
ncbi:MAG: transglutaminase family protein [Planctomycetes bacterium]|nr:transglutaminase family protein [Planctomycetota bacterium]